jgi:hypothetical protein
LTKRTMNGNTTTVNFRRQLAGLDLVSPSPTAQQCVRSLLAGSSARHHRFPSDQGSGRPFLSRSVPLLGRGPVLSPRTESTLEYSDPR